MKNNKEILDQFQVEELEQRLEMAKWKSTTSGGCTSGDCNITFGVGVTF